MRFTVTYVRGEFRFNATGEGRDFVVAQHNAVRPLVTAHETIAAMRAAGHVVRVGDSAKYQLAKYNPADENAS